MGTRINGRAKGLTAERAVADYLKANGFPDARRSVSTGTIHTPDRGDIDGVPGFAIQVKNLARRLEGKLLADTWAAACRQADARSVDALFRPAQSTACYAVIVEKRAGTTDVGRWWLHTDDGIYVRMVAGRWVWTGASRHLVRVELGAVVREWSAWSREIERDGS